MKVIKLLYKGNDGPVHLVEDKSKRRWVRKTYQGDPDSPVGLDASLLIELAVLNKFRKSANLLHLDKVEYQQGDTRLFVEPLDGEITDLIVGGSKPSEVQGYMNQILTGLYELHSHGIIHNDLKPKNILYRRRKSGGQVTAGGSVVRGKPNNREDSLRLNGKSLDIKIIDFGLVYFINFPYHRINRIQTTHHYTPPEYRDHREIGRISLNSDIYSLGIIFYYFLAPEEHDKLDGNQEYDYVFDPNYVDYDLVRKRGGKEAEDLLRKMLDYNPDRRISSSEALNHPYFDNMQGLAPKRAVVGKSVKRGRSKDRQKGGRRRWELTKIPSREEFVAKKNELGMLPDMIENSLDDHIVMGIKDNKIPLRICNLFYMYFFELGIKFVTLNYAMCLMWMYISRQGVREDQWVELMTGCLYVSIKINEYRSIGVERFRDVTAGAVLDWEKEIVETLDFKLPLPVTITKEVILFREYFNNVYQKKEVVRVYPSLYHQYFLVEMISSMMYTDWNLVGQHEKDDLVSVILSFFFDIKLSAKLEKVRADVREKLDNRQLAWLSLDVLNSLRV